MKSIGTVGQEFLALVERLSEERRAYVETKSENMTAKEFVRETHGAPVADLFPNDLTKSELVLLVDEPTLDAAKERLRLCAKCPAHGGACDSVYEKKKGQAPSWDLEHGLHFAWCSRWPEHLVRRRLLAVGSPDRFIDARFENFTPTTPEQDKAKIRCFKYSERFALGRETKNLVISGSDSGVGKTHLAISILAHCIATKKIRTALFVYVPDFLDRIRRSYDHKDETTQRDDEALIARASETDLLVLDDLCAQRTTAWVQEQLNLISNARWSKGRPTVITTNLHNDTIAETIGTRAYSRLFGPSFGVALSGTDHRMGGRRKTDG